MKRRQERLQEPKMMLQNPKKIQVLNVPEFIPVERMLDKLTIYFQRKSNGGGEVLDVEYPTSVKHCAYITFENEEDANNVLKREHILQLDEKKYKLEVREAEEGHSDIDNEQVMLFVSTKLDTRPFDSRKIRQLIGRYGFDVISYENFICEIKGSFPSLKKFRSDLMNLIPHQSPHAITDLRHSTSNKRLDRDGKSVQSGAFIHYRPQTASDSSELSTTSEDDDCSAGKHTCNIRSSSCTPRVRSGKGNSSPLPLFSSPSSLPGASSNNIEDTSPYTHRSISGLQGAVGYSGTSDQRKRVFSEMNDRSLNAYSSHSSTGPSASPHLSITVDRLVFAYLEANDMNEFHQVLEEYSVDIETFYFDDLCEIRLHPKRAVVIDHISLSHAKEAVCAHIQKVQKQLRMHQVDLNAMKSCEKQEILSRCRLATDLLTEVQLMKTGQTIHLVGPSAESYKALQYVLGNCAFPSVTGRTGPCERARRLNRSESRAKRNSSCPPIKKESAMDDSNANLPAIKHAKQTQAQTGDQQQIPPSSGYAHQRRQSLSGARKTTKDQRSPINSDVQDSQTRAGRSAEAQRMKGDRQPYIPEIRQSLITNRAMGSHRGNKKGNRDIDV